MPNHIRKHAQFNNPIEEATAPLMQALEQRWLFANDALTVSISYGQLSVTGSVNDDQITVSRSGNVWTIANGTWNTTKTATITKLLVNAKAGSDAVTVHSSVAVPTTLIGDLGNDTLTGSSGTTSLNGGAGLDSLIGGLANDILVGDADNDTLNGGAGANKLYGGLGNDALTAGVGNDLLHGDAGNDTLSGDEGNNSLNGGLGDDSLTSGSGIDTLLGDGGHDTLHGGAGANKLYGGNDNDQLTAGSGNDLLHGDAGNDTLVSGDGNNSLNGGLGDDALTGGSGIDTLVGDAGNDTLIGGNGANVFNGGTGNDTLTGGNDNDTLRGGLGNDAMTGGAGVDAVDYADHTALQPVTVTLGDNLANDGMVGETDDLADAFEVIHGSAGNDSITGSANGDIIYGNGGNDTITGEGGNDKLYGGAGNNKLYGNAGNDSLHGGTGGDLLDGGAGDDSIISIGGGLYDTLTGGSNNDTFWLDSAVTETVTDASAGEIADGAVHKVAAFQNAVSKELNGQALADPLLKAGSARYRNFKNNPLFSSGGPSIDDVRQGALGDCYFLAQIGSFAALDPTLIKQSITELGDGTYAVQLVKGGNKLFYRLDADLPSYSPSYLAYAAFGEEGSLWVAMMEKAWAFCRYAKNSYASIESGFMTEVATAFGRSSTWGWANSNPLSVLASLKNELAAGKSVTVGTTASQPGGSLMVGGHAYNVISIESDGGGGYNIVVRNPWAADGGAGNDGSNDGYVTLTAAQFAASVNTYAVSTV